MLPRSVSVHRGRSAWRHDLPACLTFDKSANPLPRRHASPLAVPVPVGSSGLDCRLPGGIDAQRGDGEQCRAAVGDHGGGSPDTAPARRGDRDLGARQHASCPRPRSMRRFPPSGAHGHGRPEACRPHAAAGAVPPGRVLHRRPSCRSRRSPGPPGDRRARRARPHRGWSGSVGSAPRTSGSVPALAEAAPRASGRWMPRCRWPTTTRPRSSPSLEPGAKRGDIDATLTVTGEWPVAR